MFQEYALFPHLSVGGNVEFGLRMQGVDQHHREQRVASILETVGLDGYQDRPINELSGGEQQRVALARTLAPAPKLVMLDEPIGALDRALREHLIAEMRAIFNKLAVTALYVTHDRDEAFAIADTVAVMHQGRMIRKGTPQELWNDPQHEFVAHMLGFNAIFGAKVVDGVADLGWAQLELDLPSGEHRLVIPPQAIRVASDGPNTGVVTGSVFRSGEYSVEFIVDDLELTASSPRHFEVDDDVSFHVDPAAILTVEP
jgi:thiamine transport system ATP-binding protein